MIFNKKMIVWLFLSVSLFEFSLLANIRTQDTGVAFFADLVSMSGIVLPNQENTLLKQLREREAQLTLQEKELLKREDATLQIFLYGFIAWSVLLCLICVNFYLDYRNRKEHRIA